jgi:hypothetical protein
VVLLASWATSCSKKPRPLRQQPLEHPPRDPDHAAVFVDLDPELYGLVVGVPMGRPVLHGVLCRAAPTCGSGSSSRTCNTPPAVSTFAPTHHPATKALASVASPK